MSILAINWNVDPELFRIGSFAVRWYGLLFVSGFVLGYWMFTKFFERENVDKRILDISRTIISAHGMVSWKYSRSGKVALQAMGGPLCCSSA